MKPGALSAALGVLSILAASPTRAQSADPGGSVEAEVMIAEISINGSVREGQHLVARRGDGFWVRAADLDRWRIDRIGIASQMIDGEQMVPLSALPGVIAALDPARQRLDIGVPPERFAVQRLSSVPQRVRPTQSAFSAFLNYDLSLEADDRVTGGAYLEAGVSDDWGLVAGTMMVGRTGQAGKITRLDTYYLRDFPESLMRLVIGDSVTDARDWSRQVRFGGVRFGTEFALQPDLVTFPVPEFADRAAVPSNVELLVNNVLRYQGEVDQGPFSINQIPVVTGAGEVTLVVRDALGVERRVRTSYYVSSRLLSRGLSAWSIEAGGERRDYGFRSFRYANPFAGGSYRRGLTDWLTVESRAEFSGHVQMAGAGINLVWPAVGEFGAAGALSRGDDGEGGLYRIFFSRITPRWNVAVSYQHASRDFDQLGIDFDRDRITDQFQATAGASFGRFGNASISWTDLTYADGNRTQLVSGNYSAALGRSAYVNLFAIRSRARDARWETTAGIGMTVAFGPRRSAYLQGDSRNIYAEFRETAPTEGGWGYRLAASEGDTDRQQAELNWRGDVGEARIEVARLDGNVGVRALASGGLLIAGKRAYATRRIEDGLGVIEVPGQRNVRIYQENRLVTRTDARGRAIIPDLRAYEENRIALSPSDLPLDVRMPSDAMIVVPRFRGAAAVRFDVERDRPATIFVTGSDGAPVEVGASARTSTGETAFVGYGGEIFVRELRHGMTIDIDLGSASCRVAMPDDLPAEALPKIGPLRCAFSETRP